MSIFLAWFPLNFLWKKNHILRLRRLDEQYLVLSDVILPKIEI